MPKNVQITMQLLSFHMLARLCSKSFKLVFSNAWTNNFQMYNLNLEKAEEPEMKLPRNQRWNCQHLLDHGKSKGIPKKVYFCFIDYAKAFYYVDHNKMWNSLEEMGIPERVTCLLRNLYAGQEATVRTRCGTDWFQIGKGVCQGCIFSPCLINLYAEC